MLKKLGISLCCIAGIVIILGILEAWDIIGLDEETWFNIIVTGGGLTILIAVIMGYIHHQKDSELVDKDNNQLIR